MPTRILEEDGWFGDSTVPAPLRVLCSTKGEEQVNENEVQRIPVLSENTGIETSVDVGGGKGDHEGLILLNTRVDNSILTRRNALKLAYRLVKQVLLEIVGE